MTANSETTTVTFDEQATNGAVRCLKTAKAVHEDRGRTHVADTVDDYLAAVTAAQDAFGSFSASMSDTDAKELRNAISYGAQHADRDKQTLAALDTATAEL